MKNKHLTLSDRNDIQIGIEQLKPSFSAIVAKLGKDPSTISKEVRRNRVIKENSTTSNCDSCPLLKKPPTFVMPIRKREATVDTRNSSTTQKELSLTMKLSSRSLGLVLPYTRKNSMKWTLLSLLPSKRDNTSTTSSPPTNF